MYSGIRDFTLIWAGYPDIVTGMKDLGLVGLEVYVGPDLKSSDYSDMGVRASTGLDFGDAAARRRFQKTLRDHGVKISAILIENDFGRENLEAELKWMRAASTVAQQLETDVVRINSVMSPKQGVPLEKYVERTVQAVTQAIKSTESVSFAMENHGVVGNREDFIVEVLEGVNSDRFGLTLDTGNFYWYGYPLSKVYDLVSRFAPYVKHTHVKNMTFSPDAREKMRDWCRDWPKEATPIFEGDIDYSKVLRELELAGYGRDITIEDESLGNYPNDKALQFLKRDAEFLNGLLSRFARHESWHGSTRSRTERSIKKPVSIKASLARRRTLKLDYLI
ncbi:MAG: sugar phosphate isomerase/epimerase family protein [Thermoprotei archaeon]